VIFFLVASSLLPMTAPISARVSPAVKRRMRMSRVSASLALPLSRCHDVVCHRDDAYYNVARRQTGQLAVCMGGRKQPYQTAVSACPSHSKSEGRVHYHVLTSSVDSSLNGIMPPVSGTFMRRPGNKQHPARQHGSTAARQHGSTAARRHSGTAAQRQEWER